MAMGTVDITALDSVRYIRERLASSVQINAQGARDLLSFDHLKYCGAFQSILPAFYHSGVCDGDEEGRAVFD